MLKWSGALVATAAIGAGLGFGADTLLRPTTTQTATVTATEEKEQVFLNGFTPGGSPGTGSQIWVYVKNGRIIRVRPQRLPEDKIQKTWEVRVGDRTYTPRMREGKPRVSPHGLTFHRRVYSPNRIKYPMKRVDWSPTTRNTQNRGKSKFVRISWDEALTTIASELKRVNDTYGPSAILEAHPSHCHPNQVVGYNYTSCINRLFCYAFGGHTSLINSPDSWEGWVYGGSWVWGYTWIWGLAPKSDIQDVLQNTKQMIHWAQDPLCTITDGQYTLFQPWLKELGIQRIFISPEYNYGAAAYSDVWIPILPNTDTALAVAIAHVWISEGTYDKEYLQTHAYGFDSWKDYVLGAEDGVAKTPEWAEPKTGIKARIIRALAREWAAKPTMLAIHDGGPCRAPYGYEWCRMTALLLAMQGLGKPGRSWAEAVEELANPSRITRKPSSPILNEIFGNLTWVADNFVTNNVPQMMWKSSLADSILNPPQTWYGTGTHGNFSPVPPGITPWFPHKDFDTKPFGGPGGPNPQWAVAAAPMTYPSKGYSEIHLIRWVGSFMLGCWQNGAKLIQAYQTPKIEFIYRMDYQWGGEAIFSDIVLPVCTHLERNDIAVTGSIAYPMQKCIEPMWESKSDFDIETLLADKLGVLDKVHEGRDEDAWLAKLFNNCWVSEFMSYDDFKNLKGNYPEGVLPRYFEYPWNCAECASSS